MRFFYRIFAIFCLFITGYALESTPIPQSIEALQTQLEQVLKEYHIPGMSVTIVHRDGPEWITGLGLADVEKQIPTTAETRFRIGSTSKGFVSLAILQLVEQGKLSLEDPVRNLVPEIWFDNPWEKTDPIRVVHLLEHTTGWDDTHVCEFVKSDPVIGLLDALEYKHVSRIARWRPGTRMAYCNSGPSVAAYIVEKLTNQSFEEYVQQNLFDPIGMETATYFQPDSDLTQTYASDGTAYPYAHVTLRPTGAINASAQDMAKCLLFYLNQGSVNGKQIVSEGALQRMRTPTSTWAAREGLTIGYGLCNHCTLYDGFSFHGHTGGLTGDHTELAYMPDFQIGYFYSINSDHWDATLKISKILRSYVAQKLARPLTPPIEPLSPNCFEYAGWYRPDSPRTDWVYFLERLLGLTHVHFKEGKLFTSFVGQFNAMYLPVEKMQFRYVPEDESPHPLPTLVLLKPNREGRFIQFVNPIGDVVTIKRIPSWVAIFEIATTLVVLLSIISIFLYAPVWLLGSLRKARRRPNERAMRIWPLVAVLSLVAFCGIIQASPVKALERFGQLTIWSAALFLTTIIFAIASIASAVACMRAPQQGVRRGVRIYSTIVTVSLSIATAYLAYWGIIGLRIWI